MNNDRQEKLQDVANTKNIFREGYGAVPKVLMQDDSLSGTAKLIYAYLCTRVNSYESLEEVIAKDISIAAETCKDLQIHRKTFEKHKKMLVDAGYITIQKKKTNDGYVYIDYILNLYTS